LTAESRALLRRQTEQGGEFIRAWAALVFDPSRASLERLILDLRGGARVDDGVGVRIDTLHNAERF
jgi:hypothetical protein